MQTFDDLLEALGAKAYYSKKIHNRIRKGKRHEVESGETHARALFQYLLHLVRRHECALFASNKKCSNMCSMFLLKEAHVNSASKVFTGGWSYQHPLPSMYQNSGLSEGKQASDINYIVCTNSLGAINHPHALRNGSNTKFPDARPGKTFQALLKGADSGLLC